jgi:hypothetical protein
MPWDRDHYVSDSDVQGAAPGHERIRRRVDYASGHHEVHLSLSWSHAPYDGAQHCDESRQEKSGQQDFWHLAWDIFFIMTYRTEYHRERREHSEESQTVSWMNTLRRPCRGETGRPHCIETPDRGRQWQQEDKPEHNTASPMGNMQPNQFHRFAPGLSGTGYELHSNRRSSSATPSGRRFWRSHVSRARAECITVRPRDQTPRFPQSRNQS